MTIFWTIYSICCLILLYLVIKEFKRPISKQLQKKIDAYWNSNFNETDVKDFAIFYTRCVAHGMTRNVDTIFDYWIEKRKNNE